MTSIELLPFHGSVDELALRPVFETHNEPAFTYEFENFFHPYVGEMAKQLARHGLDGMLDPAFLEGLNEEGRNKPFFESEYAVQASKFVQVQAEPKRVDVMQGPVARYNKEVLHDLVVSIAMDLDANRRFPEAERFWGFILDPTKLAEGPTAFWRYMGFRSGSDDERLDNLLTLLATPDAELNSTDLKAKNAVRAGYAAILDNPFQPHLVAETRPLAYKLFALMAWSDHRFLMGDEELMKGTPDSVPLATIWYAQLANFWGPKPQLIPPTGAVRPRSFAELRGALDDMGNALVELEAQFPLNAGVPVVDGVGSGLAGSTLTGMGRTLYFCIPRNQKLLSYWDKIEDRLYKVRHCMDINGNVRQLALFDPPIDPALLIKAGAAGLDLNAAMSGLDRPRGPVRPTVLLAKALELAAEVRAMGNALLAAIEKADAEHIASVRQGHEVAVGRLARDVRFLQWKQAQESTETLVRSRAATLERYKGYMRLIGQPVDSTAIPDEPALDRRPITADTFDEVYAALVDSYAKPVATFPMPPLAIAGGGAPKTAAGAASASALYLNPQENADLNDYGPAARELRIAATVSDSIAQVVALMPEWGVNMHYWGIGSHAIVGGGPTLATVARIVSASLNTAAADQESRGASAAKAGGYQRRADDWTLQANLAARELMANGRQLIGALIAEEAARREYENAGTVIRNSEEVAGLLAEKFTNEQLYTWMQGEISRRFYQWYRLAVDAGRWAESGLKKVLMQPAFDAQQFVSYNYWDTGRKGLLAGDGLYLDLKRLEMAYQENNRRELEITRHISLRQLDPMALLTLRVKGVCEFSIPEWLLDREGPGHCNRRIKAVAVSIPAVVGPFTGVSATLTLLSSSIRTSSLAGEAYERDEQRTDDRFVDIPGAVESIVTSTGVNDSGLFEVNLRDDRFLPFEDAGAISTWRLELPGSARLGAMVNGMPRLARAFDYMNIADVVLQVRMVARHGGDQLAAAASKAVLDHMESQDHPGLTALFSLPHDFASEWSAFAARHAKAAADADFMFELQRIHFPYFAATRDELTVDALDIYVPGPHDISHTTLVVNKEVATDKGLSITIEGSLLADAVQARDAFVIARYRTG